MAMSLAGALLLLPSASAFARYSTLVMDATSGEILYSANADLPRYPASLTKMMTLYMLFDAIEAGQIQLSDTIACTGNAASQPPSKLGMYRGERISVENAILALVTKSANDVAAAVADHMAGSEYQFAQAMTEQARRLGMHDTTFQNASGLPNSDQVTTAHDMAILGRALYIDFPQFYHYFSTRYFRYDGASHHNHNQLLFSYDGVDGIKTGFIRASGFNLVASATRNGRRLIGVVLGARSPGERGRIMASLLDSGFSNADAGEFELAMTREMPPQIERPEVETATAAAAPRVPSVGASVVLGTFRDRSGALNSAQNAMKRAPNALGGGQVEIVALRGKGRRSGLTYLSKINDIEPAEASRACSILRKSGGMSCSVRTLGASAGRASVTKPAAVRSASARSATVRSASVRSASKVVSAPRASVRKGASAKLAVAKPVVSRTVASRPSGRAGIAAKPDTAKVVKAKPDVQTAMRSEVRAGKPAVRPKKP